MKATSFEKITNELEKILSIKTIDDYYSFNHPYFNKEELQVDELFKKLHSNLKIGYSTVIFSDYDIKKIFRQIPYDFDYSKVHISEHDNFTLKIKNDRENLEISIEKFKNQNNLFFQTYEDLIDYLNINFNILKENVPAIKDNFIYERNTFKFWIQNNLSLIEDYDENKSTDIEKLNNDLLESVRKIEDFNNNINTFKNKERDLKDEKQQIIELINSGKSKAIFEEKINENNEEIKTIENNDLLKNKEGQKKRIEELFNSNKQLLIDYNSNEEEIKNDIKNKESQIFDINNKVKEFKDEISKQRNIQINIQKELKLIKDDYTKFDLEKEKNYLKIIKSIFPFLVDLDIEYSNVIKDNFIFNQVFRLSVSLPFDRINKSINELISNKIQSETINSYLGTDKYQISSIISSNDSYLIGIIFALKKCFKKENLILTDNNIYYLEFGNGIISKILIRENNGKFQNDIAMFTKSNGGFHKTQIFTGYSNSGFLLPNGFYIISNDLIFEMYFDSTPFLISNSNLQTMHQIINDSKIEEEKREEEMNNFYLD